MKKRGNLLSVVFIVVVAVAGLTTVLLLGKSPLLGLDLQGGASIVLAPKDGKTPPGGALSQAVNIIRQRVDGVGVGEPDITTQGNNIVIELPGVKDPKRIFDLVGQTAELRFRPVLAPGKAEEITKQADDDPAKPVTLPDKAMLAHKPNGEVLNLGPSLATGTIVSGATAAAPDATRGRVEWTVNFTLTDKGSTKFDQIAAQCNPPGAACPTGRLAIVLDSVVESAPSIKTSAFNGKGEISGSFNEREAKNLALQLRYGSLPVVLEPQQQATVSPSLGKDSLRAGLLAGAVGLGLVLIYMVLYYRALGFVVLVGLCVSGALLYTIITVLSSTNGLALSLSGATGVIVSVGVTVDSYIVYFERLKDELRSGRSVKASVGRSFNRAWRTILVADGTSFIGAVILYVLTVGPVRGFAFTLALSTALDCVVAWFFTRPVVGILGRNRLFTHARFFGVARGFAGVVPV